MEWDKNRFIIFMGLNVFCTALIWLSLRQFAPPFLKQYLNIISVLFAASAQVSIMAMQLGAGRWLRYWAFLTCIASVVTLPKFPWTYPGDFSGYILNLLFFPIFMTGLNLFNSFVFGAALRRFVNMFMLLAFFFPVRAVFKLITGSLPPNGFSLAILMLFLALSYIWAGKYEAINSKLRRLHKIIGLK